MRKHVRISVSRMRLWLRNPWAFAILAGSALLYVTFLISGLTEDVLDGERIVAIDGWLVRWLAGHRSSLGISVFNWITLAGNWQVVLAGLAVAVAGFWKGHQARRSPLPWPAPDLSWSCSSGRRVSAAPARRPCFQ
jgi:hypothetical protein